MTFFNKYNMIYIFSYNMSMKSNYTNLSNYLFACVILFMHIKSNKFSWNPKSIWIIVLRIFIYIFYIYVLIYISGFPTYYSPRQWFDCWFLCIIKVNWINLPTNKFLSIYTFSDFLCRCKCTQSEVSKYYTSSCNERSMKHELY